MPTGASQLKDNETKKEMEDWPENLQNFGKED